MMKAKIKLVTVAMVGVFMSGMLLASLSSQAETSLKIRHQTTVLRWDGDGGNSDHE